MGVFPSHQGFRCVIFWSLCNRMKKSIMLYSCLTLPCSVSTFVLHIGNPIVLFFLFSRTTLFLVDKVFCFCTGDVLDDTAFVEFSCDNSSGVAFSNLEIIVWFYWNRCWSLTVKCHYYFLSPEKYLVFYLFGFGIPGKPYVLWKSSGVAMFLPVDIL